MQPLTRIRIIVRGAVQGVGFRPFVYRSATELGLAGWVSNSTDGLIVEADGQQSVLEEFVLRVHEQHPPHASIHGLEYSYLDAAGFRGFEIRESVSNGPKRTLILPDIATCADCIREIFDPCNRRYLYPFTNCTNCGPRFTIIESLPYDRANTTMRRFDMCALCREEYEDPRDRRFHAQPNACPACGPELALWDPAGAVVAGPDEATEVAVDALHKGLILAVKGVGGFHLMADAENDDAVRRLRRLKHREEKPFALMAPSLNAIEALCNVSPLERRALTAPEAPIVILRRRMDAATAGSVAPANPYLGIMLPYTPLHHILLRRFNRSVVATSGNVSAEPIAIDDHDAVQRLHAIADFLLVHDRPIQRHIDDSVVRIILGREQVLRRARGYAPMPVRVSKAQPATLAVGGHLKNTVALAADNNVFVSQHVGDLGTREAFVAFTRVIDDFQALYEAKPTTVAADLHPDYASTGYAKALAETRGIRIQYVQHHWAHVVACMAENSVESPALGVAWDGSGYGPDGTVWGGEFLLAGIKGYRRVAHLRTFPLPGGDAAARRPQQTAMGLLYEMFGRYSLTGAELPLVGQMLEKQVRCPRTSSAGRLFDAVASLLGIRDKTAFEGQAAMELEFAVADDVDDVYPYIIRKDDPMIVDWAPMLEQILSDRDARAQPSTIAAKFHNTLAVIIVDVARRVGEPRVLLTGGCFQNRYLTERTVEALTRAGFAPYWHQRVPPNDGGIALGQAIAAQMVSEQEQSCVLQFQAK